MSVCNYVLPFKVVIYAFPYLLFLTVFVLCVKEMLEETPEEYVAWKVRDEENRRLARHARWERDQAEKYRLEEERKAEAERRRTEVPQFTMPVEDEAGGAGSQSLPRLGRPERTQPWWLLRSCVAFPALYITNLTPWPAIDPSWPRLCFSCGA